MSALKGPLPRSVDKAQLKEQLSGVTIPSDGFGNTPLETGPADAATTVHLSANGTGSTEASAHPSTTGSDSRAADDGHHVAAIRKDLDTLALERARSPSPAIDAPSRSSSRSRRNSSSQNLMHSVEIESPSDPGTPGHVNGGMNDSFTQQLMAGAIRLKTSLFRSERISFSDVARNPTLAKKARAEMHNHQFSGMIDGEHGALYEGRAHDLEVTRLQMALDVVEADAEEESRINAELAQLVCLRLDASRKAVERLLGILHALSSAEAAYTRAMNAVSRVKLVGECDGPTLRAALARFSDIPWLIGEAHGRVQVGLVDVTKTVQEVVSELRKDSQSISLASGRTHTAVGLARKALHGAFLAHRTACRAADDVALERTRNGWATSIRLSLEQDPWLTESKVVAAHTALNSAQDQERSTLAAAYERVRTLEEHRCEVLKHIVDSFLLSYRGATGPDAEEEEALKLLVEGVDCDADLAQFSASAAAAVDTGKELAMRQAAALELASQDLLCSPDIIRQGQIARWKSGSGKWCDCHCILTRSGFLHWLASPEDVSPLGGLNLARCQFEAGEAPNFNINESVSGLFSKDRRMCFQASSVEDCCEWAIALRESIASHKAK